MREIEQKYLRSDTQLLLERLAEQGASGPEVHDEADHYFNAPDRDFARTREAFRLRRIGQENFLTYKAPRARGTEIRDRVELEIPLPPGDQAAQQHIALLQYLGYRPVAVVHKSRQSYALRRDNFAITVTLDDLEDVGEFAEIEVLASDEDRQRAIDLIPRLASELGLTDIEPASYLELVLRKQARNAALTCCIVRTAEDLRREVREMRRQGRTVGFVPTMGALHRGHLALMEAARADNDCVVVSIFVNPTQFGPNEDLSRYPRPFEEDVRLCSEAGVALIFHPNPEILYPPGFRTHVEVTGLQDVLEGASRPGHFRGVATVVLKLFNLVQPDRAYFGQKDAQQIRVLQQMVRDLDVPVELLVQPTVREADGLALSSRNRYLDEIQRRQATVLSRALNLARDYHDRGERDPGQLERVMRECIQSAPDAHLDYAVAVDADTLLPVHRIEGAALLALAVRIGDTRLIDNLPLPAK